MKISVRADQCNFSIPLPNWLLLNPVSFRIVAQAVRKNCSQRISGISISPSVAKALVREIRRLKKRYGSLTIVEIYSANGEHITITL